MRNTVHDDMLARPGRLEQVRGYLRGFQYKALLWLETPWA